jgi:hypothetical protein
MRPESRWNLQRAKGAVIDLKSQQGGSAWGCIAFEAYFLQRTVFEEFSRLFGQPNGPSVDIHREQLDSVTAAVVKRHS